MSAIDETKLPGVGVRHDFTTARGERIGVLQRMSGDRDLLVYDRDDADACQRSVRLDEVESEVLAELLGVSRLTQSLGAAREVVGNLVVEWLPIEDGSPFVGRTIGDTQLRTRTGSSVIAILRGDGATPAPGPQDEIRGGDTLIVVGTLEGVRAAGERLQGA